MFSTSRTLAQSNSAWGRPARSFLPSRICGIGSTPVSAMRPANTDTTAGTLEIQRFGNTGDLLQGKNGGDVEFHAFECQLADERQ